MGFKADASFLRFLTMGAAGAQRMFEFLKDARLEPVELERYCTTNKIWETKVKRLRLADILCVKTGVRFEVRAKSDLKIRMSDAPDNPERTWDAGLRDEDVVALIACEERDGRMEAAKQPVLFSVRDLRSSVSTSKLGPPKSASEGAERDRTWPCCVPSKDGVVLAVEDGKIKTKLALGRTQRYRLEGKVAYVRPGDRFVGGASIIAGSVPKILVLSDIVGRSWRPSESLRSVNASDRYAATKALPHRPQEREARQLLEAAYASETEPRVRLEIAGSLARLQSGAGYDGIQEYLDSQDRADLRMEAVLILTELADRKAAGTLREVAHDERFSGLELRQAAVWGLGRAGARAYDDLLAFLGDDDPNVVLHAIAAFGTDTPRGTIQKLINLLDGPVERSRASASEALRVIGGEAVLEELVNAARMSPTNWVLATLGRLPASAVRTALQGTTALARLEPLLTLMNASANWMAAPAVATDLQFLLAQVPQAR